MSTYSTKSNCRAAARAALGKDATEGVDFKMAMVDGRWTYTAKPKAKPPAHEPPKARRATKKGQPTAKRAPKARKGPKAAGDTKQDMVIAMLRRPTGASASEIQADTGWQPHTCRGFVAAVVKKRLGLQVETEKVAERGTVYRIG